VNISEVVFLKAKVLQLNIGMSLAPKSAQMRLEARLGKKKNMTNL
jgi:hypothetical protein